LQQIWRLHLPLNLKPRNFFPPHLDNIFNFLSFHWMPCQNPKSLKVIKKTVQSLRKFVISISSNLLHFNEVLIRLQKLNEKFFFRIIFSAWISLKQIDCNRFDDYISAVEYIIPQNFSVFRVWTIRQLQTTITDLAITDI
jgi:hypothetical protein